MSLRWPLLALCLLLPCAVFFAKRHLRYFGGGAAAKVIEGKQGHLYFAGEGATNRTPGRPPYDDATLRAWTALLESRRDYLRARGIGYLFVPAPDKQTIYPEYLPELPPSWQGRQRPGVSPRLAQLLDHLAAHSTVPVLDLRPTLLAEKSRHRVYQYTDTHWSTDGGFVTYQALVRKLAEQRPGLEPLAEERFRRHSYDKPAGDLADMLGDHGLIEKDFGWLEPIPPLTLIAPTLDASLLSKRWLAGTEPQRTDNPEASGTLLLFKDSYAGSWMYFLGQHFRRVLYIWQYHFDKPLIERERPQVVVDEILERFLIVQDPNELRRQDEGGG